MFISDGRVRNSIKKTDVIINMTKITFFIQFEHRIAKRGILFIGSPGKYFQP